MESWRQLREKLLAIDETVSLAEKRGAAAIESARPEWQASVRNFIHYLALRQLDVTKLQLELANDGLSSLGRAEGYVLGNLRKVLSHITCEIDRPAELHETASISQSASAPLTWVEAEALLHSHTRAIFGPKPATRHVYIMVTAPDPSTADDSWFDAMIDSGMNLLRINAAHGTSEDWRVLAERAKRAAERSGRPLRIAVDLPGPKLRTIALAEGPRVLKLKPMRDVFGNVVLPCRVRIGAGMALGGDSPVLPVSPAIAAALENGDFFIFTDARGRKRKILINQNQVGEDAIGTLDRTAYLTERTQIHHMDAKGKEKGACLCSEIPSQPFRVTVMPGACIVLCQNAAAVPTPFQKLPLFACTLPGVFKALRPGMPIMIDDGKIMGRVDEASLEYAVVRIERAARGKAHMRGDMGINLPETSLEAPAFTEADQEALAFAEEHADIVSLSFIRSLKDVRDFERRVRRDDLSIILKIETRAGFEALPSILLEFLGMRNLAVMIARGDLAVEVGFARLAEVQEEILWLCEAAHIPVIWATQVLETLAKTGFPTRSEVTDAAMSVRAECVMLNKGPFIEEAVRTLASILIRMEMHQYKRRQLYRPLKLPVPAFIIGG